MNDYFLARIATALEALAVSADVTRPETQLLNVVREVGASVLMRIHAKSNMPTGYTEHDNRTAEIGENLFDVRVSIRYLGKS